MFSKDFLTEGEMDLEATIVDGLPPNIISSPAHNDSVPAPERSVDFPGQERLLNEFRRINLISKGIRGVYLLVRVEDAESYDLERVRLSLEQDIARSDLEAGRQDTNTRIEQLLCLPPDVNSVSEGGLPADLRSALKRYTKSENLAVIFRAGDRMRKIPIKALKEIFPLLQFEENDKTEILFEEFLRLYESALRRKRFTPKVMGKFCERLEDINPYLSARADVVARYFNEVASESDLKLPIALLRALYASQAPLEEISKEVDRYFNGRYLFLGIKHDINTHTITGVIMTPKPDLVFRSNGRVVYQSCYFLGDVIQDTSGSSKIKFNTPEEIRKYGFDELYAIENKVEKIRF